MPLRLAWPVEPGAFRLFLAMIVFVHHFSSFAMGAYAVYVFFVLSGFWLHTMWTERYSHTRRPYLTYMTSRVWRLAPVMVLVSALTIPLLLAMGIPASEVLKDNPFHLAFSSTFLLGYTLLEYAPVGSAWSLDIEMQFYVLVPFLAVLLVRGWRWPMLAGAVLVSATGAWLFGTAVVLPKYAVFFMAGMVAAQSNLRPSKSLAVATFLSVPVVLVLVTLSPWREALWGGASASEFHHTWGPPLNAVLALVTVPFAIYTVRQNSDATDRMFADLSYIVYLTHWIAMQWFFTFAGRPFQERLLVAAACFAAVPLVSWLIWQLYDKPLNRLRARWVSAREVPAAPPAEEGAVRAEPAGP